jgi:hypothetical protein
VAAENTIMKCTQCGKLIEAAYYGAFSRALMCHECYSKQATTTIQEAVSPTGDKEPVATEGVTLDKVEPAVVESID